MNISAAQWFWLLLSGRLSQCLLLRADDLRGQSVPDLVLSAVLGAAVLLFLLHLGTHPAARYVLMPLAAVVWVTDAFRFADFADNTAHAEFPVTLFIIGLLAVGVVAALYGLEALGRAATVVGVVSVLIFAGFAVAALILADTRCFPPTEISAAPTVLTRTLKQLPHTAEIVAVAALARDHRPALRATRVFIVISSALSLITALLAIGVLGDAVGNVPYPFYTAVSASPVRLDAAVLTLWLITFFVRSSLFASVLLRTWKRRTV